MISKPNFFMVPSVGQNGEPMTTPLSAYLKRKSPQETEIFENPKY